MSSIVKVIEVLAQSPKSFDDAARNAVKEAGKSVEGIKSVWISDLKCDVENNDITAYRVHAKVSFVVGSR